MKPLSHYIETLSGISLKLGIKEYFGLQKKFGVYSAFQLSADVKKIEKDKEEAFYGEVIAYLFFKNKELQGRLLQLILAVRRDDWKETPLTAYEEMQEIFDGMREKMYSPERWRSISMFFTSNGLFVLGEICREKARDACLHGKCRLGDHWRRAVWYLELGDLEHARQEIDRSESGSFMKKYRKSDLGNAKIYYNILCGPQNGAEEGGSQEQGGKAHGSAGRFRYDVSEYASSDARDAAFARYARGQDFLVIGPAPRKDDSLPWNPDGLKIVRANDRGEDHGEDPVTSISYYNGSGTRWLGEHGGSEFASRFDFVVVKNASKNFDTPNMHRVGDFNCILPDGHLNMLPVMVLDLNYNGAGKIYVCGNNLFFTKNPWKKGYQSEQIAWNRTNFWPGLCDHEIYSQFHLLQNAFRSHAFIADEELDSVLSMTVREYAKGMEKIYSIP